MTTNAFSSLANIRLHLPARLVSNSCCPDKDLIVLFSRLGGTDRMSLWSSNHGSRKWEVDVGDGNCHAINIAWSPDGQSIAVVQDPPAISLHSLQDGHMFLTLTASYPNPISEEACARLTAIWWFREEANTGAKSNIPDIFKRNDIITGSSHSVLKLLPLLDNLQEDTEKLTATDVFAFQGSHTSKTHKRTVPQVIENWPTLSTDFTAASLSASSRDKPSSDSATLDETDNSNFNSVLLVADDSGRLFTYLDGTFPLGFVQIGANITVSSMVKHPRRPRFIGSPCVSSGTPSLTSLQPINIEIPLLMQRKFRDLAKMSSTSRELVWYVLRVVKEMHEAWYGSESNTGARNLGPKWVEMLESKQKEDFGEEEVNPILDLTCLLTTGRSSESLSDFLGSGEQMSDRGIQKWESTVSDALIKLRDCAEKRVAPALQRLHLLLDELLGWSKLPQFSLFELSTEDIKKCLDLASTGIVIASWLAATSRTELCRFREFISWLRFELNNVNNTNEANVPRHDILEVNNYFISGLASSSIDNWFIGPSPQLQLTDLGILDYESSTLKDAFKYAFKIAEDSAEMGWQTTVPRKDISHLDRNVQALVQDLAGRCERVFHHAASATSRSAIVSYDLALNTEVTSEKRPSPDGPPVFPFRERTVLIKDGDLVQNLVAHIPSQGNNMMLLAQLRFKVEAPEMPSEIGIALLECYLSEEEEEDRSNLDLLDADFFDDECVVIIYRTHNREEQAFIAMLDYNDIGYQNLVHDGYVRASTREDLMQHALELWRTGQIYVVPIPISRRRALSGCRNGGVSLALNGRVGRRVSCVLDGTGTMLEAFDMEGVAEDVDG